MDLVILLSVINGATQNLPFFQAILVYGFLHNHLQFFCGMTTFGIFKSECSALDIVVIKELNINADEWPAVTGSTVKFQEQKLALQEVH